MTGNWAAIVQQTKDHLALNPTFEPTDEELEHLYEAYEYFEDLGLCE